MKKEFKLILTPRQYGMMIDLLQNSRDEMEGMVDNEIFGECKEEKEHTVNDIVDTDDVLVQLSKQEG